MSTKGTSMAVPIYRNSLQISPSKLVTMADEECQILKHSHQWVETINPSIVVMKEILQGTVQGVQMLFDQLSANLTKLTKMHQASSNSNQDNYRDNGQWHFLHIDNPDWVYDAPSDLSQRRTFQGRVWSFCMKYGHHGKWVCTHTDSSHRCSDAHSKEGSEPEDSFRCNNKQNGLQNSD
jgi:hypothetical protein